MDGQYWRPNHVNKRVVADIWLLTVSWTLTWEMMRIRNFYCFVYRQHIWLRKWEVIVGDMIDHVGIYGSRVAEGLSAFNVGLVSYCFTFNMFKSSYFLSIRWQSRPILWKKHMLNKRHIFFSATLSQTLNAFWYEGSWDLRSIKYFETWFEKRFWLTTMR